MRFIFQHFRQLKNVVLYSAVLLLTVMYVDPTSLISRPPDAYVIRCGGGGGIKARVIIKWCDRGAGSSAEQSRARCRDRRELG